MMQFSGYKKPGIASSVLFLVIRQTEQCKSTILVFMCRY